VPLRVLTDEHLSPTIGPDLATLGYDVVPVHHRGLLGWEDWDLMAWCAREQRAICTNNAHDFEREHRRYEQRGEDHWGILIVGDWTTDEIYWSLCEFLESHPEEALLNQVVYLSKAPPDFITARSRP
jgi:predicted nuclease of predicted toxin-antitoxin system